MKVEVNENKQVQEREFPKLMVANNGEVVLFESYKSGTVLKGVDWKTGHYSNNWSMNEFSDFNGSITLSNE